MFWLPEFLLKSRPLALLLLLTCHFSLAVSRIFCLWFSAVWLSFRVVPLLLFHMELAADYKCVRWCLSTVLENPQPFFHHILLLPHFLSVWKFSYRYLHVPNVSYSLFLQLWVFVVLFCFLILFYPLHFGLDFSIDLFSSTNPIFSCVHSAHEPILWILNFRFVLFSF